MLFQGEEFFNGQTSDLPHLLHTNVTTLTPSFISPLSLFLSLSHIHTNSHTLLHSPTSPPTNMQYKQVIHLWSMLMCEQLHSDTPVFGYSFSLFLSFYKLHFFKSFLPMRFSLGVASYQANLRWFGYM